MGIARSTGLDGLIETLSHDGKDFEVLCKWFLENDPLWSSLFRKVWLWEKWPDRWGRDKGIDLIAEDFEGRIFAIQAKNYASKHSITKSDVDKFLSESNRPQVFSRVLIGTTDQISPSALEVMQAQEKQVTTCLLDDLRQSDLEWPSNVSDLTPVTLNTIQPRPHQVEALEKIDTWSNSDETLGQVVMACGTGKSLVGVWAADRLDAKSVLILVPTIALLRQIATTWMRNAKKQRRLLMVCGETGGSIDSDSESLDDEMKTVRTTDPVQIAEGLSSGVPLLVVSTYTSSPQIAKAMTHTDVVFDLAIADEAHRCAGLESSSHKTILDQQAIRARRRLFFTATPTIYGTRDRGRARDRNVQLASMDDRSKFGRCIHHLSFAEATDRGLLCPYQVAVIPVKDSVVHDLIRHHRIVTADGDEHLDAASLATQIACARAMRQYGCLRMVAFQRSIPQSKKFSYQFPVAANLLSKDQGPELALWSRHVDGAGMRPAERAQKIERFCSEEPEEHRLLSNVKLLAEGVDIPNIDSIAFIDTHRGQAQIIQAVGRAVRPSKGKTVGTIVLPVVLRPGETFQAALSRSEHKPVVDILGALRSHDPEIAKSLDGMRFEYGSHDSKPGRFVVDAPVQVGPEFAEAVELALANALGVKTSTSGTSKGLTPMPRLIEPQAEPSRDETFERGLIELSTLGWNDLLPCVPDSNDGFPLAEWWEEAKRRWAEDELTSFDKRIISSSVSWLAADLARQPDLRDDIACHSNASITEQILSQLRADGRLNHGKLREIARDPDLFPEMVDPMSWIHRAVTHAAMRMPQQISHFIKALSSLATVLASVTGEVDPEHWNWESRRLAVVDGFADELRPLNFDAYFSPEPRRNWRKESEPEAFQAGADAARREIRPLSDEMLLYRFAGDEQEVEYRTYDQIHIPAKKHLDELGWEIFLLARADDGDYETATQLATNGSTVIRGKVKADFLLRGRRRQSRQRVEQLFRPLAVEGEAATPR